jgi:hypothetical protein
MEADGKWHLDEELEAEGSIRGRRGRRGGHSRIRVERLPHKIMIRIHTQIRGNGHGLFGDLFGVKMRVINQRTCGGQCK